MYVRPAWETMYKDPEVAASWARFSTHKPRDDGLRPESNLKDLEGEALGALVAMRAPCCLLSIHIHMLEKHSMNVLHTHTPHNLAKRSLTPSWIESSRL